MLTQAYTNWETGPENGSTSPEEAALSVQKMGGSVAPIEALPAWMIASLELLRNEPAQAK